jgi:ribosomal protein L14
MSSRILDFLGISAWRRQRQKKKLVRDLGKYIDFGKVADLVAQQEAEQATSGVRGQEKRPIQSATDQRP